METIVPRPRCLRGVDPLPTTPTRDDEVKRQEYRKFLKIRTYIFFALTVTFLSLGIFLLIRYDGPNRSSTARGCGIIFTVLGITLAIITSVYFPTFTKLVSSKSASIAYNPKSAEALTKLSYPRQPLDKVPQISSMQIPLPYVLPTAPPPMPAFMEPNAPPPPPYSEFDKMQY
nr:metacestode specific membrane protein 1 [Hymenolepis microstoma]